MLNPMDMSGKTILVTGASSGIGSESAILLSRLGAKVILVARDTKRLEDTTKKLCGNNHFVKPYDLTKTNEISGWLKNLANKTGMIDGLVHSAGIRHTLPLKMTDNKVVQETMNINLNSAVALAKAFRQKAVHQKKGSMVFLSSVLGLCGEPGVVAYSASKGAILAITKALAAELARDGIRVNCVVPAIVKTEMVNQAISKMTQEQFKQIEDKHLLGIGEPIDVANSIAFLLADCSKWITGAALIVDGGYTVS